MTTELWKPLSLNTKYEVSTYGNFRNAKTKKQTSFNIDKLKSTQTRIRVNVKNNIKQGTGFYLHRLIALTFIPNPNNLEEVNHIDGNPYNNFVENLEWITHEDNMRHFNDQRNQYENKSVRQVVLCTQTHEIIQTFKCIEDCIVSLGLTITYASLYKFLNTNVYTYSTTKKNSELKYGTNTYVGVNFNTVTQKYIAVYKHKYIGRFDTEIDAAKAYDTRIRELGIVPCIVNFPNLNETQAIVGKKNRKKTKFISNGMYEFNNQYLRFIEQDKKEVTSNVEWRQLEEIPNYSVSNTGLVKHTRLNRILSGYNRNGYLQVTLHKENIQCARLIHRLVATAFIPNEDASRIHVDHIDSNPRNNHVSNLRWVTPKENMNNELTKQNISAGHMKKSPKVYQIDIQTGSIERVADNAIEMTKQMGASTQIIQVIANYYKKTIKSGVDSILLPIVNGQQKTYEDKWIFLYEKNMSNCLQITNTIKSWLTHSNKKINVAQIDKNTGVTIALYTSMYEASIKLNINYSGISQVYNYHKYEDSTRPACYKLKSTHGFIFKDA